MPSVLCVPPDRDIERCSSRSAAALPASRRELMISRLVVSVVQLHVKLHWGWVNLCNGQCTVRREGRKEEVNHALYGDEHEGGGRDDGEDDVRESEAWCVLLPSATAISMWYQIGECAPKRICGFAGFVNRYLRGRGTYDEVRYAVAEEEA